MPLCVFYQDPNRLHYEPWELAVFENIECEWPMFYAYLALEGIFLGKREQVNETMEFLHHTINVINP